MYRLIVRKEWDCSLIDKIDSFIMNEHTNGEFINTVKYLGYHNNRFLDDSLALVSEDSKEIQAVVMCSYDNNEAYSHCGTTFSGIILDERNSIEKTEDLIDIILDYYESKYNKVSFKMRPSIYDLQPNNTVDYLLLQRGYHFSFSDFGCLINLQNIISEDDLFKNYESKRRNEIRKSLKYGIFDFKQCDEIYENVWNMMNRTLSIRYSSKTTHSFEEITMLRSMFPNNITPYYMFSKTSEYGAFALIYRYKNVFHTQYLDLNYEYSKYYPNLALVHNLILVAKAEGYKYFSFGGCTIDDKNSLNHGLYNYKKTYGSGNVMLPVYIKKTK